MSDELQLTTVRLFETQLDALDAMAAEGAAPNRSEALRSAVGFALDHEEFTGVDDDVRALAGFKRARRLSQVHFYREGFEQQVRTVLSTVGSTRPPWDPETVRETAPKIFERQIRELFDSDQRRAEAREILQQEIESYAEAYRDEFDESEHNPYVDALTSAESGDEFRPDWMPQLEDLVPDAQALLLEPANGPSDVRRALELREHVDDDLAREAVERALSRLPEDSTEVIADD